MIKNYNKWNEFQLKKLKINKFYGRICNICKLIRCTNFNCTHPMYPQSPRVTTPLTQSPPIKHRCTVSSSLNHLQKVEKNKGLYILANSIQIGTVEGFYDSGSTVCLMDSDTFSKFDPTDIKESKPVTCQSASGQFTLKYYVQLHFIAHNDKKVKARN